jgi:hypothetical protein
VRALKRASDYPPEALPAAILDDILGFSLGVLTDDVALLAVGLRENGDAPDSGFTGSLQGLG